MRHPTPLKFLGPVWFTAVMGLAGLAQAWWRAGGLMGEWAQGATLVLSAAALLAFVLLLAAGALRARRHAQAWADDFSHPLRHPLLAAIPVSLILLGTLATALLGPTRWSGLAWGLGCALQLACTLWVLSRWWRGPGPGGLQWMGVTPLLIIPVVGNVLAPLAGVALGAGDWAAAQFGLGVFLWLLVMALLLARLAVQGLWPERLLASSFILVAPPAVIGLALLALGAPAVWAQAMWGVALLCLLWAAQLLRRVLAQPFTPAFWALGFPTSAFAGLTLALAEHSALMRLLAMPVLALASLLVLALAMATWRGLRDGSLLAPEPVAVLQSGAPPAASR